MHTLDNFALLQFRFGHTTNAVRAKVCVTRLDATQAAQVLVARLFPLGNEIGISDSFLQTILVELTRNDFASVEHVVNVAGFLMVDLEDWPERLVDSLAFVWLCFGWKRQTQNVMDAPKRIKNFTYLRASSVPYFLESLRSNPSLLVGASCFFSL